MPDIGWDDFELDAEEITENDVKEIEEGPNRFVGDCIAVVIKSDSTQIDWIKPPVIGIKLTFEIEKILKIGRKKPHENAKTDLDYSIVLEDPTSDDQESHAGETIFYDMPFYYNNEPDWSVRRRKEIAIKTGLAVAGQRVVKSMWEKDIIGLRVVLHIVENRYVKDNELKLAKRPQIDRYNGFDHISTVEGDQAKQSNWDDI